MDPIQIRQAIREVKELRSTILQKQLYQGYSGRARILGGMIALAVSVFLMLKRENEMFVFWMWGFVFAAAAVVNYGAILVWHMKQSKRDYRKLAPVMEAFPVWIVAGVITLALYTHRQFDLLYGTWMALFAIVQGIERTRMPKDLVWIGTYYLLAGIFLLFNSADSFTSPLYMGLVFFVGETCAGLIMHIRGIKLSYRDYLKRLGSQ